MATDSERFEGGMEQIARMRLWSEQRLRNAQVEATDIDAVLLALTEAYSNVMRHAYEGRLPAPLKVELEVASDAVVMLLHDEGRPFEPVAVTAPDPDDLAEGGYGLFLIEALMDEVSYTPSRPSGTVLRLLKRRAPGAGEQTHAGADQK